MGQLISIAQNQTLLGVHPESVRRWIRAGKLKAAKAGRHLLISRADLKTFWKNMGGGADLFGVE